MTKCKECGRIFEPTCEHHKFCCKKCRRRWHNRNQGIVERQQECKECHKTFITRRPHQIFCSKKCQRNFHKKGYRARNPKSGLTSATVGAISELRVAIDLMFRGYATFRALSPSCPCDLAVLKDGKLLRIEVTSGYYSDKGKLYCNHHDSKKYDVLAVVTQEEIVYIPSEF